MAVGTTAFAHSAADGLSFFMWIEVTRRSIVTSDVAITRTIAGIIIDHAIILQIAAAVWRHRKTQSKILTWTICLFDASSYADYHFLPERYSLFLRHIFSNMTYGVMPICLFLQDIRKNVPVFAFRMTLRHIVQNGVIFEKTNR